MKRQHPLDLIEKLKAHSLLRASQILRVPLNIKTGRRRKKKKPFILL